MLNIETRVIVLVLVIHAGLLAWCGARHSPTIDEVGHFSAGLSHWRLNRFDLYNVNPPFVRTIATAPLQLAGKEIDFSGYEVLPGRRTEFGIGARWIASNSDSFLFGFTAARWACIPFSLLGAMTCFLWARESYGSGAGWMALCLWSFCPNVLAHGSLMTPDAGATAIGVTACYAFRKWLIHRSPRWMTLSGIMLGLTLLTKFTWLFLLGLWPACWLALRIGIRDSPSHAMRPAADVSDQESQFVTRRVTGTLSRRWRDDAWHLCLIVLLAFWVLNNGYLFEDSFQRLGDFQFFSASLSGNAPGDETVEAGNRFRGTLLEHLPMPVPRNFVQGIDHIKFESERGYPSYLRGVKRQGGWWFYYLYAMLVKLPVGTLALIAVAVGQSVFYGRGHRVRGRSIETGGVMVAGNSALQTLRFSPVTSVVKSAVRFLCGNCRSTELKTRSAETQPLAGGNWFETFYLLTPAVCILWLVSSQTGFNHHLRYVLPAFPFLFIFASRSSRLLESRFLVVRAIPLVCIGWMIISSLSVYPHCLSYFNELAGGSINGWKHLDNSNIDWGQDMILVREWADLHVEAQPLYVVSTGYVSAKLMGIRTAEYADVRRSKSEDNNRPEELPPGWYIIGLTRLVDPESPFHRLLHREPDGYIGFSMRIYHVKPAG